MSLKDTAGRRLATASAGLGVTSWSSLLTTMGVVALLASGAGFWAGSRWEEGAQAIADSKAKTEEIAALKKTIDDLVGAAKDIKQAGITAGDDYRRAASRLEGIAHVQEQQQQLQREFSAQQQRELAQLLASRPDLDAVDVGPQLLEHWNRSNRGRANDAAAGAAAGDRAVPAAPVPAAAGGNKQSSSGAARQPRRDGRALQPVPHSPGGSGAGREDAGGYRVGVVLQGAARAGIQQ